MADAGGDEMTSRGARTAIVTGGARGIGAASARRLAADGFAVGVLDLDKAACDAVVGEIKAAGGWALSLIADIAVETEVEAATKYCVDELGPPLLLVNNAGIIRDNLLFRMSLSDWDAVMNVHLRGSFLMTRAVQGYMIDAQWGRVINMSSISALGNRGQTNYAAAKAGLQGFTKTLAIELGKFGVTANCIAPGYIETDMLVQTAERLGITYDEFAERTVGSIPVGRMGKAEDIAAAVAFFAREDTSFITGQILYVSGGPEG
jgi:3-oxoacyl-[acyl-carrier protein] reductase